MNRNFFFKSKQPKDALLVLCTLFFLGSCSFKKDEEAKPVNDSAVNESAVNVSVLEQKLDPNADIDGDGVLSSVEIDNGTDPYIADIPELETSFVQNFSMSVGYTRINDNTPFELNINTKIKNTDSSYKYRVGKLFGIDNALKVAAKEGRFSGHSYSNITNQDYSWVKYPSLDPLMHHSDVIKFRSKIDLIAPVELPGGQIVTTYSEPEITIVFDSTVKLKSTKFKEIKNLSLNFYYHDLEKGSFVQIKNVLINRTFQPNIHEKFSVEINNVPLSFLKDTYLKKGEFLVSEVDNYYIPELNKDYKTLMASVKSKTVPVLVTTPSDDKIYYVSTGAKGISFLDIMSKVFVKNYEVENNKIKRIGQYENNLGSFQHLKDLKDKDKNGNWFVLTNSFKQHYMDHIYNSNDHITLSYITGTTLASQEKSIQNFYTSWLNTVPYNETQVKIGEVSPNSKIELQLKGARRFGNEISTYRDSLNYDASFPVGGRVWYNCTWENNKSVNYDRDFNLPITYKDEWLNVYLVVNEERFSLSKLIEDKKVIITNIDFSYLVSIENISNIKPIKEAETNSVSLVFVPRIERAHLGVRLVSYNTNTPNYNRCTYFKDDIKNSRTFMQSNNGLMSKNSMDAENMQKIIRDAINFPNDYGSSEAMKWKVVDDIDYIHNFSVSLNTKIINYFN